MNLSTAITEARRTVRAALQQFRAPALLWSSGKDSMALLHFLRSEGLAFPVIQFRDPQFPARYDFANRIIRDWQLTVHSWPPLTSAIAKRNGHLSIIHRYQLAPGKLLDLPVDLIEDGESQACGLQDVLFRPKGTFTSPWDAFFHGARSADADALLGAMPLQADIVQNVGAPACVFPLRNWSDELLWQYLERYEVPYQQDRYEKVDGQWRERADKTGNPDYLPGCTRCLDPDGPAKVPCPKLGIEVNNISKQLPRIESAQLLPDYIERENHAV